ncbi:MAG: Uma2 family endonuclease [Planctomycetes bacterium]|nr:Uma2 family endonuclease [Planctomycetota bacterium]
MITVAIDERECTLPDSVKDLRSYLDWMHSDESPEIGHYWWLQGQVWVDYDMEEIFSHALLKTEFAIVLGSLVKAAKTGLLFTDGVLISNPEADISGEPDGLFVSHESVQNGSVQFVAESPDRFTVLQGSPDMVLEIVSRSSVRKDKVVLRQAYWAAGVKEYWLVDARRGLLQFDILRRTSKAFQAVRKQDGWMKSSVFCRQFRLVQTVTSSNLPEYSLEVR